MTPPQPGSSILVVDDEAAICRLVATLLQAQGHKVHQAGDGNAALEVAAQLPVELLVTDVRMRGMDGLSLAREMANRNPQLKIIFMSGYFDAGDGRPVGLPAGWEFISKPFALPELVGLVNKVLLGLVPSRL
jgi:CheY-like chemotaxis protein